MKTDKKLLQIISNETKNSIDQLPVVTPSIFASIFSNLAKQYNVTLENESGLSQDLIQTECEHLTKMQSQASENANILTQNTSKAIHAIKEKDDKLLHEILEETEKLKHEIEKLKESVYRDELTHLYNRKWLHDNYIDHTTNELNCDGMLAVIDLNYFKIINDTHGHIIGDKVLIFVANQLKKTSYSAIRYGGDEFLLLIPSDVSPATATERIHNLREDITTKSLKAHDSTFKVSFSFGTSIFKKGDNLVTIIEVADQNMYKDKLAIKKRITGI